MKEITKDLAFGQEARDKLIKGANTIANAVKATLGPKGRNVVIEIGLGKSHVTKDGVSVAKEVYISDPMENLGAQMFRDVARKTADLAGDGTTTSIVLAQALLNEGMDYVQAGGNPMQLKRDIDAGVEKVVTHLKSLSKRIDDPNQLLQIANISANGDKEIGHICSEAIIKIGKDGVVAVEEGPGLETTIETIQGMQFSSGYMSTAFVTNRDKATVELRDCVFFVTDIKLAFLDPILPLLEKVQDAGKDLVMIIDEVDMTVLQTIIMNKVKGALRVVVVNPPAYGELRTDQFKDICAVTGAHFFSNENDISLSEASLEHLGNAESCIVTRERTTIIGGKGDKQKIELQVGEVKAAIEKASNEKDKTAYKERLGRLTSGVAVIKVGGSSELEVREKKDRIDDAVCATKAALEEGFLPGGGLALLRASLIEGLHPILVKVLQSPVLTLAKNAGLDGSVIVSNLIAKDDNSFGFDFAQETYIDLVSVGVIDPTKVTRVALQDAASVSGLMITSEVLVVVNRESLNREF